MLEIVKIPERRKGVLIGADGSVKGRIEKSTNTVLTINDGVEIEGESLEVMKAKDIVKAVGRGFSPEKAMLLLSDDFRLVVISMEGERENTIKRLFARVIGTHGKTKRIIEKATETCISVYGKTVSIIGKWESAERAGKAIELLLEGKTHTYVYKFLEGGSE
ncbi:MAG: RNA-processing protein [Candidatus Aenigmarchaeota archaeon]|nr:RNA-processing protein [Candidatus Aenigmarchaeota archaeon]